MHSLINKGLDPNTLQGKNGDNALTLASFHCKFFLFPLLLSYGLNYQHKNNFNQDFWSGLTFKEDMPFNEKLDIINECKSVIEKMNYSWGELITPQNLYTDFFGQPLK